MLLEENTSEHMESVYARIFFSLIHMGFDRKNLQMFSYEYEVMCRYRRQHRHQNGAVLWPGAWFSYLFDYCDKPATAQTVMCPTPSPLLHVASYFHFLPTPTGIPLLATFPSISLVLHADSHRFKKAMHTPIFASSTYGRASSPT